MAIGDDKWEIYVGGAGGSHVRKGDLLCTVEGHDAVMRIAGRFMQFYREDAKYKERTYTWVERIGIGASAPWWRGQREIGARLRCSDRSRVAAYTDPWKEAAQPKNGESVRRPDRSGGLSIAAEHVLGRLADIPAGRGPHFRARWAAHRGAPHSRGDVFAQPRPNARTAPGRWRMACSAGATVTCPLHERVYDLASGRAVAGECGMTTYPVQATEEGLMLLQPATVVAMAG